MEGTKTGMKWLAFLGSLLLCYTVAALGGWWTSAELTDWYLSLKRPSIAPPNWVFGPVWSLLYALMAVAAWEIWLTPPSPQSPAAVPCAIAPESALDVALFSRARHPQRPH